MLLDVGFAALEAAFGRGLGVTDDADAVADLAETGLAGALFSSFDGRRNCSSAFRFVPATVLLFSEAPRDTVLGLRTSDFAVEDETGDCGWREVPGGIAEGFPVSIDESTESRNCRRVSEEPRGQTDKAHILTLMLPRKFK